MKTRREFLARTAMAGAWAAMTHGALAKPMAAGTAPAEHRLEMAPYKLEVRANHFLETIAYNGQVPGPLLRLREGRQTSVEIVNGAPEAEIVHWHGLFLPPAVDGAMEEGTPMIAPGQTSRVEFTPEPAGFRWYHTHTFAGTNFKRGQYTGQHGFLMVDASDEPGRYDQEAFVALHDWRGQLLAADDGSMNPTYDICTMNGRTLGFGEPLRVKAGQRLLLHVLNSSPTEVHWMALAGHAFQVVALDGNPVPKPQTVEMLRLAPAERVCAIVELNKPGVWVLGEVRKHIQSAGMGMVVEYAGATGKPQWIQPETLAWDYANFAETGAGAPMADVVEIPLVFSSKFVGHGSMDHWLINGKSYPDTETPVLHEGQRYRLLFQNHSMDDHPVHLHRHTFDLTRVGLTRTDKGQKLSGLKKDVVLVPGGTETAVEFTANHPGSTLFHCHQQNHMDAGFMMLFRYA
jgi:FtsP/CotA-like multicopper oxidase with cupredoxin domain